MTVPARITYALEKLAPRPGDRLLEIGCGTGVAAAELAATRRFAALLAIDRSALAVAQAQRRAAAFIAAGKVQIVQSALAGLARPSQPFDQAFAINVNLFWRDGAADLAVLRRLLKPRGRLLLVWQPPSAARVAPIREAAIAQLTTTGFALETVEQAGTARLPLLSLICR